MGERPDHQHQRHTAEFEAVVDPDIDLGDPIQVEETARREWDVLLAVALGGILGAEARYGLGRAIPRAAGGFPWATLLTNVLGCLLIGVLMVLLLDVLTPHRLIRPLLGTGVLGGFTTFSTFEVDAVDLVNEHHAAAAVLYVLVSLFACLLAVWAGMAATTATLMRETADAEGRAA